MKIERVCAGFIGGVCDHIAVERTKQMPGSSEVREHSALLQMAHQETLMTVWVSIKENNDIEDVVDHLENLTGENLELGLLPHIDYIAGYAIGAACAGYSPMILEGGDNAIDIRTGEFWFVQPFQEPSIPGNDVRLAGVREGAIFGIRWAANDEWDETLMLVKGSALPAGFLLPLPGLLETREPLL